jgi:hypothetical protein
VSLFLKGRQPRKRRRRGKAKGAKRAVAKRSSLEPVSPEAGVWPQALAPSPAHRYAEARLGRKLTSGELALDIDGIDADLNAAKDALQAEIAKAVRRAISQRLRNRPVELRVSGGMDAVLAELRKAGQRHAVEEIRRLGIEPRVDYADALPGSIRQLRVFLQQLLGAIRLRVILGTPEAVGLELRSRISKEMIDEAERKIPGVRDAASRLVSGGFTAGLADVYEQHADLFPCWQYSAVMDNATCAPCRSLDGERYYSLEHLYVVLPNFGPNPSCLGDGRCRCRGVPCAPEEAEAEVREHNFAHDLAVAGRPAPPEGYRQALEDLDSVLTIRSERERVPPVKLESDRGLSQHRLGEYRRSAQTSLITMNPRRNERDRRLYLWHELGHYIDDRWLGGDRGYGSERAARNLPIPAAGLELQELMDLVQSSEVARQLRELREDPNANWGAIDYLLRGREIFARAFSQYVATKLDDREVAGVLTGYAGHEKTRGTSYLQWTPEEFRPIEAAFDRLFARLGWLP